MKHFFLVLSFLVSLSMSGQTRQIVRSIPEAEGIPSAAIGRFFDSLLCVPRTSIHSVMVLRHDKVVAEMYPRPFNETYSHTLYSCSKTFVSAAVGIAVDEGRLRLTDRVVSFFPDDLPDTVPAELKMMTVRDLLTMSSGIEPDWNMRSVSTRWVQSFLSKPVKKPGRQFKYDSICTYLLSAIVQKVTGQRVLDFLRQRLFTPMGITDVEWEISPEGYNTGGWGLRIQSESMAKFGLLLLHHGLWQGRRLISAAWVNEMMKKQIENGQEGYGYQMWLCPYAGAARADGAFGQYIFVIPDKDMVVVITQCSNFDGRKERSLLWRLLVPEVSSSRLRTNRKAYARLVDSEHRTLPFATGTALINRTLIDRTWTLAPNKLHWKKLSLAGQKHHYFLTVTDDEGLVTRIALGYRRWLTTATAAYPPYSIQPQGVFQGVSRRFLVSASYGNAGDALNVSLHYVNWITALELTFESEGDSLKLTVRMNHEANPLILSGTSVTKRH